MLECTIKKVSKQDLGEIYEYMLVDFPDNERKPLNIIESGFETGFMEGYGLYALENQLIAYALFVKLDNILLFDYLAVVPKMRESGVGSTFIQKLRDYLSDYECVIGEVENPDYCTDEEEKSVMNRRIQFYLRNGIRDTGASGQVYGVEYRFFELEGKIKHTPAEAIERINQFYRTYWPKLEDYNKYVQIHNN